MKSQAELQVPQNALRSTLSIGGIAESTSKGLPPGQASTNLPAISDALSNEAKDLPGLVSQTQTSVRELERLIEALQKHWLVRKYVDKTNPLPAQTIPASPEPRKKPPKESRSLKYSAE